MFRIVEDDMPPLPDGCSDLLKDFLKQCFQKDPFKRPNAEMLCEHEWLKQNWVAHRVCCFHWRVSSFVTYDALFPVVISEIRICDLKTVFRSYVA